MPWRIELLGGLRVRQGEQQFARFANQKGAALLAYLAYHRKRSHSREALAELLWPEAMPEVGRHNLRQALLSLRRQLEPTDAAEVGCPLFLAHRSDVQLSAAVSTDIEEFEAGLKAAQAADPAARAGLLAECVALYQGPLLPDLYDEWVLPERERLSEACLNALHQLILLHQEAGDLEQAIETARRAVALDPLAEPTHLALMRLLIAAKRSADALRQYGELERILREQLDEAPSAETAALARQLSGADRPAPAPAPPASLGSLRRPLLPPAAPPAVSPGPAPRPAPLLDVPLTSSPLPLPLAAPRLPAPVTRFFGRETELERVGVLLSDPATRLITLTGPGGSGKTRLAIEAARRATESFGGGAIWFVPLADRSDARMIPDAIVEALQIISHVPAPPLEQIVAFLGRDPDAPALLILDNFEHLIDEGAMVVADLIERVPSLTCLVTSRQRLEIEGEHELPVLPLPVPVSSGQWVVDSGNGRDVSELSTTHHPLSTLLQFPSVQLFLDRARASRPDFAVTARNAEAVAALCQRLEGIPLALELAAARVQMLTPSQMLLQLEARFDFLVSRRRDIAPRHRTLRAAFGWSYELLSPDLRRFFAGLSVFQGRWTLEAAEAVCGGSGVQAFGRSGVGGTFPEGLKARTPERPTPILDYLTELRERSLILVMDGEEEMSFRMLETLREFAAEQLAPEEQAALRQRHAEYYLALAEQANAQLNGPEPSTWLDRLEAEHDNVRAALGWLLENGDSEAQRSARGGATPGAMALRLAGAMTRFWDVRRHISEGREWLDRVLSLPGSSELDALRAKALFGAGVLAQRQDDHTSAWRFWSESLAIRRRLGDRRGVAEVINACVGVPPLRVDPAMGTLLEESLAICRELEDRRGIARALYGIGSVAAERGDYEAASASYGEALALYREINDRIEEAATLRDLGHLADLQGDDASARMFYEQSLAIDRELEDPWGTSVTLYQLGKVAFYQGDTATAQAAWEETLALDRAKRGCGGLVLHSLAWLAAHRGDIAAARALCEECLADPRNAGRNSAYALMTLGELAYLEGDVAAAQEYHTQSLALFRDAESHRDVAIWLGVIAGQRNAQGQPEQAARLFGAAEALRETHHAPLTGVYRAKHERDVGATRAALDKEAFAVAWAAGRQMSLEAAISHALRGAAEAESDSGSPGRSS